jgi:glycosyltransferase 2 family protein
MAFANAFSLKKHWGGWVFGVLALAAVILVVFHLGDLEHFMALARGAQPQWLLLALALQGLTYVCAAGVWYCALARIGQRRPLRSLVPLGIAKLFTDQVLPSGGISGTLMVIRGLARRQVPPHLAMGALLVGLVSYYAAYGLAAVAALAVLQFHHQMSPAVVGVAALFALFAVGVPVAVLNLRGLGNGPWLRRLQRIPGAAQLLKSVAAAPSGPLRNPALMAETTVLQLGVFVLDGLTLYVMLLALGQPNSPLTAFAAFVIADVVATLGPIPLGLGTFEATAVAMLAAGGLSLEAALAATLLLRGFTFWLPMLPGLWLARHELGGHKNLQVEEPPSQA